MDLNEVDIIIKPPNTLQFSITTLMKKGFISGLWDCISFNKVYLKNWQLSVCYYDVTDILHVDKNIGVKTE